MRGAPWWLLPNAAFKSAWANRVLLLRLARREIEGRYRGSILGLAWSVIVPVVLLCVYTFVFSVVFQARWQSEPQPRAQFALVLFTGLILFNVFSECLIRSPTLIMSNATYVKKVVFPLEVLPWVCLLGAAFNALISAAVLAAAYLAVFGLPPLTVLWLPLICIPLLLISLGVGHFFSALGVYLRDLQQFVGILSMLLMFLSPLFYPVSAVPERFRALVLLNPLASTMEMARGSLFWSKAPPWGELFVMFLLGLTVSWAGFAFFMKTRKGFADVL